MKNMQDHSNHRKNSHALWWRFLLLTLPVTALVMLSSYLFFQSEQQTHLATVRLETAHHIESQAKNIKAEIERAAKHVLLLASHKEIIETLKGDQEARTDMRDSFRSFAQHLGVYDQIRLLDQHGHEALRINFSDGKTYEILTEALQDKSSMDYFTQTIAMPAKNVFISKFTLNIEHGQIEIPHKPVIRYATPVINMTGEKIGVVVLNFLGKVLINRYLDATNVTGENMLLNANSFFIHAEDESKTWGSILDEREDQYLADRFPDVWNSIVDEQDGQLLTSHGLFTFATIAPYELLQQEEPRGAGAGDWVIVSYISDRELYGDSDSSLQFIGTSLILLILWAILTWLWSSSEMRRQQAHLKLVQLHRQERYLVRRQMTIQEEERRSLALSLHDDMGQSLTSIQAYIAAITKAVTKESFDKVGINIQHIRDITSHIQQSVRGHLQDLRPASLDRLGLCAAIEDMLREFARRESVESDFVCKQDLPELCEQKNIHLFRIVQEALTNIAKYAQADHVKICLSVSKNHLNLKIIDDGCGMIVIEETGLGLLGMRERTALLQGEINIESALDKGTCIDVIIPIQDII